MRMYGYIGLSLIGGLLLICSQAETCPEHCECTTAMVCRNLTTFPDTSANLTDIEFLNCSFSSISAEDIKAFVSAEKLTIFNSKVKDIADGAFEAFSSLTALDLSVNPLLDVTKEKFVGLTSLEHLYLAGCDLTLLPDDFFSNTPTLKRLRLDGNEHLELTDGLLAELHLEELHLHKCGLTSVPSGATSHMGDTLARLDLSHNLLQRLEKDAFSKLERLEMLNLDSCFLEHMDEKAFEGLDQLREIELGNNNLTSIAKDTFDDSRDSMKTIRLNSNKLTTLHYDLLDWQSLTEIELRNNPWDCDCGIHWMSTLSAKLNASCQTPEELSGWDVQNATSAFTDCPIYDSGNNATVALAIAIPIILIGVLLIGYYVYKIIQTKRRKSGQRKSVRYSAVYKDTVESAPAKGGYKPTSDL